MEAADTDDMRDVVTNQFFDKLQGSSNLCQVLRTGCTSTGAASWIIAPIEPTEENVRGVLQYSSEAFLKLLQKVSSEYLELYSEHADEKSLAEDQDS